ncbi:MAG TPA: sensor histidine kinase [Actinomycetota bacterium]|nr:sensor histidine kinase [Actinomycetota bacterium]
MEPAVSEGVSTRLVRLAWVLGAIWLVVWLTAVALAIWNRAAIRTLDQIDPSDLIIPIGFAVMGTLIASRQPRNPIGWIFLGIALSGAISGIVYGYVFHDAFVAPLPASAWVAWVHDPWDWLVFPAGLATFFFLLFPDGRLHSRRARWLAGFAIVVVVVGFVFLVFQETIELNNQIPAVANPLGSLARVDMQNGAAGVIYIVGILVLLTAMAGTILRARRSTGEQRQQLRWLGFAAALTASGLALLILAYAVGLDPANGVFDLVIVPGFGVAVPVSCGIAILKYGLFDLDLVISKTVVYALLAAFFTAVYLAIVVGIGTAIGSTHDSFLTVLAAATIAVAFTPVRTRATRLANRLVYGTRASPYEVLSEFSTRVAGTYDVEDVLPRMATLLGEGTGASDTAVWLRVGEELRPSATWGTNGSAPAPVPMSDGVLPEIPDVSRAAAVRHQGELLGALTVTKQANDPMTGADVKLVDDLAAQAGLVLRNVRLTAELRANLEELRASRQRLVTAQDGERRRLERNIHDGAQQQLVALAVQARMAESIAGTDPERERELLQQVQQGLREALQDLRDLARGIYPPLLADQGLGPALEAQVRRSSVPVTVEADGVGRYPQDAEAAVYFCVLEALQNVAKYAEASRVSVRLEGTSQEIRFAVQDDGRGFDPAATGYGTGVQGMKDRLAALGGSLEVRSSPGAGTTVAGAVPA